MLASVEVELELELEVEPVVVFVVVVVVVLPPDPPDMTVSVLDFSVVVLFFEFVVFGFTVDGLIVVGVALSMPVIAFMSQLKV